MDDILQAVNKGAVWIFLLGNVLTGAINRILEGKISTVENAVALPIITVYLALLTAFVLAFFPKVHEARQDAGDGRAVAGTDGKKHQ